MSKVQIKLTCMGVMDKMIHIFLNYFVSASFGIISMTYPDTYMCTLHLAICVLEYSMIMILLAATLAATLAGT